MQSAVLRLMMAAAAEVGVSASGLEAGAQNFSGNVASYLFIQ